jgi:hypothetical protein
MSFERLCVLSRSTSVNFSLRFEDVDTQHPPIVCVSFDSLVTLPSSSLTVESLPWPWHTPSLFTKLSSFREKGSVTLLTFRTFSAGGPRCSQDLQDAYKNRMFGPVRSATVIGLPRSSGSSLAQVSPNIFFCSAFPCSPSQVK